MPLRFAIFFLSLLLLYKNGGRDSFTVSLPPSFPPLGHKHKFWSLPLYHPTLLKYCIKVCVFYFHVSGSCSCSLIVVQFSLESVGVEGWTFRSRGHHRVPDPLAYRREGNNNLFTLRDCEVKGKSHLLPHLNCSQELLIFLRHVSEADQTFSVLIYRMREVFFNVRLKTKQEK